MGLSGSHMSHIGSVWHAGREASAGSWQDENDEGEMETRIQFD